jgi:hypothetical protein
MSIPMIAGVKRGVYYASATWAAAMDASFEAEVSEPNDELLWASVLPRDVVRQPDFWWGDRVVHVERHEDIQRITPNSWFAHVKHLEWATALRHAAKGGTP